MISDKLIRQYIQTFSNEDLDYQITSFKKKGSVYFDCCIPGNLNRSFGIYLRMEKEFPTIIDHPNWECIEEVNGEFIHQYRGRPYMDIIEENWDKIISFHLNNIRFDNGGNLCLTLAGWTTEKILLMN